MALQIESDDGRSQTILERAHCWYLCVVLGIRVLLSKRSPDSRNGLQNGGERTVQGYPEKE